MKLIETKYEATLKGKDGSELRNVKMRWDGVYMNGKEMWAVYYPWNNDCVPYFTGKNHDNELYDAGYYKVIKLDSVEIYEDRIPQIL